MSNKNKDSKEVKETNFKESPEQKNDSPKCPLEGTEKTAKKALPSIKSPVDTNIESYFSTPSSKQQLKPTNSKDSEDLQTRSSTSGVESIKKPTKDPGKSDKSLPKDAPAEKHKASSRQLLLSPKKEDEKKKKKSKPKTKSKKKEETSSQPSITEHFAVRRSQRKCKSKIEEEKRKSIEIAISEGNEDGLEVREVEGKGRGVFALKTFERGDLVVEYAGDLIDINTAKDREKKYSQNKDIGCYMYYFVFGNKKYCVDATEESGRLGRLLNHSVNGNCTTKVISINDSPCLILIAAKHIKPGEELLYDYGERAKDAIASHPWLQL